MDYDKLYMGGETIETKQEDKKKSKKEIKQVIKPVSEDSEDDSISSDFGDSCENSESED